MLEGEVWIQFGGDTAHFGRWLHPALVEVSDLLLAQSGQLLAGVLRPYTRVQVLLEFESGQDRLELSSLTRQKTELSAIVRVPELVGQEHEEIYLHVLGDAYSALAQVVDREFARAHADREMRRKPVAKNPVPMRPSAFWRVVDEAGVGAHGEAGRILSNIQRALATATPHALAGFHLRLLQSLDGLKTPQHREAVELVFGFTSDDVFADWRAWLITRGRATYEAVLADPDALADIAELADSEEGAEALLTLTSDLHEAKTDFALDLDSVYEVTETNQATRRDRETILTSLPRLSARFPDDGIGGPPIQRHQA